MITFDGFGAGVVADPEAFVRELKEEAGCVLARSESLKESCAAPGQAGALAADAGVEGIVGARGERRRIEVDPLAGGELCAQAVRLRLEAADPERRILDVEVSPVLADARGPAPVRRAVDALVQHRRRPRMLHQLAAVPEAALLVEPQPALFAQAAAGSPGPRAPV